MIRESVLDENRLARYMLELYKSPVTLYDMCKLKKD